jgi:hypothetical protein
MVFCVINCPLSLAYCYWYMKRLFVAICLLCSLAGCGQKQEELLISHQDTTDRQKYSYVFTNQYGDTVLRLDTQKYYHCFCYHDTARFFVVVGVRHKQGWWAIDKNEQFLFRVFNTSDGEPSPDNIRNGMIRIVDSQEKIGFANYKGQIVIKPQFEAATSFYKGKAIVGTKCRKILWSGDDGHEGCKHYATDCESFGYIDSAGKIQKAGYPTFEQVQDEIGWIDEK